MGIRHSGQAQTVTSQRPTLDRAFASAFASRLTNRKEAGFARCKPRVAKWPKHTASRLMPPHADGTLSSTLRTLCATPVAVHGFLKQPAYEVQRLNPEFDGPGWIRICTVQIRAVRNGGPCV